jgi:hypothetical protein
MAKTRKAWVFAPPKAPAPKMPASLKTEVQRRADELVATVLKPKYIQPAPAPDAHPYHYLADIYTKWFRHYFYFCSKYCTPGPNALAPSFEDKFARLEYTGETGFNLSFMRHTGEWVELYSNLSLDECLAIIGDDGIFAP